MKTIEYRIRECSRRIEKEPENPEHFRERAFYWEQLRKYGESINDLHRVLEILPEDEKASRRIQYLKEILKFNNRDIFSDTNTRHDPWME